MATSNLLQMKLVRLEDARLSFYCKCESLERLWKMLDVTGPHMSLDENDAFKAVGLRRYSPSNSVVQGLLNSNRNSEVDFTFRVGGNSLALFDGSGINLSPFLGEGLSSGYTIIVPGLYTRERLSEYAKGAKKVLGRLIQELSNPVEVNLEINLSERF